jgi:hypothetical protein
MPFDETGPARIFCTACGTPHHEDCYQENGGCTVFGCARAPADDPKLQVSQSDLRSVNLGAAAYAPAAQPYVPPAAAAAQPSAPSPYGSSPLGLSQSAGASATPSAGPATLPAPQNLQPPPPPRTAANPQYPPQPGAPYGYQYPQAQYPQAQYSQAQYPQALGIHNFYGGYTGRAVGQLCLTVLTLGYLGVISWIWAIVEICVVDRDSAGVPFQ